MKLIQRLARVVIAGVLGGLLLLVLGYWIGPERFSLLALAQYAPFPVFLAPALAALGFSLALGRIWRLAAALGVAVVGTSVMGLELNRGEPGTHRLRVMTYNIKDYVAARAANGLGDVALEIGLHDPDLLFLQDARRVANLDDSGAVLSLMRPRQVYSFGQYVVASKFPLRDCGRREIPFRGEAHTYVTCVMTVRGEEIDVVTAHLLTPRSGLAATRASLFRGLDEWKQNVSDRMTQTEQLGRDLRSRRRPVILGGDLNAPPTSLVVRRLLAAGLRDAFAVAGTGYGHTWGHSLRPHISFLRLDHILVGPEFGVADCFVGEARGSEHRPVIADLYLSPQE